MRFDRAIRRYCFAVVGGISLIAQLLCCPVAHAEARHSVTLKDLLSLKSTDWQMELSPDGGTLAYVVSDSTGETLRLASVTDKTSRIIGQGTMPRWSPDGMRLAFYSSRGGTLQLWIINVKSSETSQITNVSGGITPNPMARFTGWIRDPLRYCWSPDGTKIVFVSQVPRSSASPQQSHVVTENEQPSVANSDSTSEEEEPLVLNSASPRSWGLSGVFRADYMDARYVNGKFVAGGSATSTGKPTPALIDQLFLVDLIAHRTERLTENEFECFNPDWSSDGKKIAFVSTEGRPLAPFGTISNIYVIDVQTRRMSPLTTGDGEKRLPRWSSDGKWIAYLGGKHLGRVAAFVVPGIGGDVIDVSSHLDRSIFMLYWLPSELSIVIGCIDGVAAPIMRIHVPDGRAQRLTKEDASYIPFTVSRSGALAWAQSDGSGDGVLYIADSEGQKARVLADVNPQTKEWFLGKQEVLRWMNSRGEEIEGIVIKPIDYQEGKSYPLIVDPYSSRTNSFMSSPMLGNQAFASRGYAVFLPNDRAPHSVGNLIKSEAYSEVARGPLGVDVMVDDVMTGIDALVKRGIADPARMCLYGFSNGGGATNLLVTRTSRFKCAVSAAGVLSDWSLTFFLGAMGSTVPDTLGGATPWENPEAYIRLSPVYHLDKATTPMLLAVGDKDVLALLLSLEMYYGFQYLGRDVTLLRYPKQAHGFTGAALEDYWQRANRFFDFYLEPNKQTISH